MYLCNMYFISMHLNANILCVVKYLMATLVLGLKQKIVRFHRKRILKT